MTINQIMEAQIKDELGSARFEIVKQRAIIAAQKVEIDRLSAALSDAAEKGPSLPLDKPEEPRNGAHH